MDYRVSYFKGTKVTTELKSMDIFTVLGRNKNRGSIKVLLLVLDY